MNKLNIQIHNLETNEVIVREMTDDEFAHYQLVQDNFQTQQVELEANAAKRSAAQAKLAALGLTVEDLQALGL